MELRTPRGMRDFMPEEMAARIRVISVVESVFRKYGYEPLDTPALEEMQVLSAKIGEETNKQIYRVEDGKLGMRFDLTVPFARVVASNPSLQKPFKRYCIGKVWRREEPQKGRFREFLQADIDVAGSQRMECEAELISCACECLGELGFSGFEVKLNNRKVLDGLFKELKMPEKEGAVFRALDKLEKIGENGVRDELSKAGVGEKATEELMGFVSTKEGNDKMVERFERYSKEGAEEIREVLRLCSFYGVDNVTVDPSLVRGLDYYTGPVFEISAGGGVGSISGGGRYDNMISGYGGGEKVPAVGISLGIERVMAIVGKASNKGPIDLCVSSAKPEFYKNAIEVARELRSSGLSVQVDLMGRNLRKQFDYANSKGIRFIVIIGQREIEKKTVTLRNLGSGEEKEVSVSQVPSLIGK